jgi:hypothetical protein
MKLTASTTARTIFNVKSSRASKAQERALEVINIDVMTINVKYQLENVAERVAFMSTVTGILYAVKTGRLSGEKEMQLRKMSVWEFSKLVVKMLDSGVRTDAQAVEYLHN